MVPEVTSNPIRPTDPQAIQKRAMALKERLAQKLPDRIAKRLFAGAEAAGMRGDKVMAADFFLKGIDLLMKRYDADLSVDRQEASLLRQIIAQEYGLRRTLATQAGAGERARLSDEAQLKIEAMRSAREARRDQGKTQEGKTALLKEVGDNVSNLRRELGQLRTYGQGDSEDAKAYQNQLRQEESEYQRLKREVERGTPVGSSAPEERKAPVTLKDAMNEF